MKVQIPVSQKSVSDVAHALLGIPYKHLGRKIETGLDCFGLVAEFYRRIGAPIDDVLLNLAYVHDWFVRDDLFQRYVPKIFRRIGDLNKLRLADVVTMQVEAHVANHLAIFIGDGFLLNTSERVGVHRLRLFVVWQKIASAYRHEEVVVT